MCIYEGQGMEKRNVHAGAAVSGGSLGDAGKDASIEVAGGGGESSAAGTGLGVDASDGGDEGEGREGVEDHFGLDSGIGIRGRGDVVVTGEGDVSVKVEGGRSKRGGEPPVGHACPCPSPSAVCV